MTREEQRTLKFLKKGAMFVTIQGQEVEQKIKIEAFASSDHPLREMAVEFVTKVKEHYESLANEKVVQS